MGNQGSRTHLFFANVEMREPQAHRHINDQYYKDSSYGIVGLCETHVSEARLAKVASDMDKDGWKCTHTAALATGKSAGGTSGGELVAAKKGLATSSFDHIREAARRRGDEDPFRGFAAMTIHTRAGNCVFVCAYMVPSWGPGSPNQAKLASLAAFLAAIDDPWVVAADWNLEPDKMQKLGFPTRVKGEIVVASGTSATCTKARGTLIDYCLVRQDFASKVKVQAIWDVPWKVHCGLDVELQGAHDQWWVRQLVVPKALPRVPRPKAEADPDSKTSRAKQQRLLARSHRLPEELQEAFVELHGDELQCGAVTGSKVAFAITTGAWREARPPGGSTYLEATAELDSHLVYQLPVARAEEGGLSRMYADWIGKLEEATLDHREVEEDDRWQYRAWPQSWLRGAVAEAETDARQGTHA